MPLGNKEIMAKNIQYFMDKHDVDRKTLCIDLNLKYMTVADWINGKTYPRIDKIELLANYFGINKSDLVEEKNHNTSPTLSIIIQSIVDTSVQLESQRQHNVLNYANTQLDEQNNVIDFPDLKEEEYVTVQLYGVASAGKGLDLYDEVVEEIPYPKPVPNHDIALRVHGDSMEPIFRDDEIIFIKKSHEINHGQIGVFILNGQGFLKKFYRDVDGLRLVSLNKKYDDLIVQEFNDIQLVGVVVM
ncbi:LexA family transcriptional regulator [Carnobacteriaceae bacterium zg-ZUI252]|nr:LexA family transcriptional regulator [Carnobacteriaceae bacterium zg-ZUI252]MBS4770089.1 LexA family transcriptional regulator [Carnobacteriaceae bacterium zg-ZUI240]